MLTVHKGCYVLLLRVTESIRSYITSVTSSGVKDTLSYLCSLQWNHQWC